MTRKWNIVTNQPNANYDVGYEIISNTDVLKSNLCDYNNAYILVKGNINVIGGNGHQVEFKNCALFTACITKIDGTAIDDVKTWVWYIKEFVRMRL